MIAASASSCNSRWRPNRLTPPAALRIAPETCAGSCAGGDPDCFAHHAHHPFLYGGRHPGPERHREVLARGTLGLRPRARLPAEEAQRRLEVERRRVVDAGADPGLAERRPHAVTLRRAADEHVVDVARIVLWQLDELAEPELRVARRRLAAAAV